MSRARNSRWKTHLDPVTRRAVYQARTRGGTPVWVAPTPGFRSTHASLTARFGSLDTTLPDGTPLPAGTAHFLEHRMFQTPEGDVFDLYASRGASANAYTSFDHTSYLFDCTRGFEANLTTLLQTLRALHTDDAGMDTERQIIGQEIAMYADDPAWRGYFGVLEAMYRKHPVRIDIAGTDETIRAVDAELLGRVHAAYYHPRNLILVVAGDVEPDLVLAFADRELAPRRAGPVHRRIGVAEPTTVRRRQVRTRLPIDRPHVALGLKETAPGGGLRGLRRTVESAMVLDILCADGGRIQRRLYDEGVIDDTFGHAYEADHDYAFGLIVADIEDVSEWQPRILAALERAARVGISEAEVERCRRKLLGRHLRTFDAPEELAYQVLGVALEGEPFGAGIDALRAADGGRLSRRLSAMAAAPRAWSIVAPG